MDILNLFNEKMFDYENPIKGPNAIDYTQYPSQETLFNSFHWLLFCFENIDLIKNTPQSELLNL